MTKKKENQEQVNAELENLDQIADAANEIAETAEKNELAKKEPVFTDVSEPVFEAVDPIYFEFHDVKKGVYRGTFLSEYDENGIEALLFKTFETGQKALISKHSAITAFLARERENGVNFDKTVYQITYTGTKELKGGQTYNTFAFAKFTRA